MGGTPALPATPATTEIVVGIVTPGGPTAVLADDLARDLATELSSAWPGFTWTVRTHRDGLLSSVADEGALLDAVRRRKVDAGWDLALCLTDLPLHAGRRPVVAHASSSHGVGLVSLPALGPFAVRRRLRDLAVRLVARALAVSDVVAGRDRLLRRLEELGGDVDDGAGRVRYAARVLTGNLRLLAGMVRANRPWRLALGLSKALVAALATGAFVLVTPDIWLLGDVMGPWRSAALALLAVGVPVVVLIVSADLWESAGDGIRREQVVLFNMTTVATLVLGFGVLYLAVWALAWLGAAVLVVPALFADSVGHPVSMADYLRLTWATTSLAVLGGALGAGLESDDTVRAAAYRVWPDDEPWEDRA